MRSLLTFAWLALGTATLAASCGGGSTNLGPATGGAPALGGSGGTGGAIFVLVTGGARTSEADALGGVGGRRLSPDAATGLACTGGSDCGSGEFCTTLKGICDPPPGCAAGAICPPICYGTCQPIECGKNADCKLVDDYCTGCDCRALRVDQGLPACQGPGVRCFAPPCAGLFEFCFDGACITSPGDI
jgi:hypothetical protein